MTGSRPEKATPASVFTALGGEKRGVLVCPSWLTCLDLAADLYWRNRLDPRAVEEVPADVAS